MSEWHLYLVRTADGALYTGVSTDVDRRFAEHCDGTARGSRYLRGRGPLELVYSQRIGQRGLALRVESRFKRLTKERKEQIVQSRPDGKEILSVLDLEAE